MKYFLYIFFLGIVMTKASAQTFSKDVWHDGTVFLFNQENAIRGKLKYDFENDLLQMNINNSFKSFGAFQVESFEFVDELQGSRRNFFTLPFQKSGTYESPMFFELLLEGSVSLLCRERIYFRNVNVAQGAWNWGWWGARAPTVSVPVLEYVYYVLTPDEKVQKFTPNKSNVLSLMPDYANEVADYIEKNKLSFEQREHLIQIFAFYSAKKQKIK